MTKSDLFTTDEEVVKKLKDSHDEKIIEMLDLIRNINVIEVKDNYGFHLKSKVRWTDPKILISNKILRLSELDKSYKHLMKDYIDKRSKGFFVRIRRKN